jgi:hypothetical protein
MSYDLTGQKFGRLTALSVVHRDNTAQLCWRCVCECGNHVVVPSYPLRTGNTKSCGCLSREGAAKRMATRNRRDHPRLKHGHAVAGKTREFQSWLSARRRCRDPRVRSYKDYGAKGVRVCSEWESDFGAFLRDMGPCPVGHTLERLDPTGNYEPGNTTWIPAGRQARNKGNNIVDTCCGIP